MEKVTLRFNDDPEYAYEITISDEGVLVTGCDCNDIMTDDVVRKVYEALGEYLKELDETSEDI